MNHIDKWFLYAVIGALSLLFGAMTPAGLRAGCHLNDYQDLAEQYAPTLDVELAAAGINPPPVSSDGGSTGGGCFPGDPKGRGHLI
jgi:hypothetical protein